MRRKVPVKVAAAVLSAAMVMSGLPATAGIAAEPKTVEAESVTDVLEENSSVEESAEQTEDLAVTEEAVIDETIDTEVSEGQDITETIIAEEDQGVLLEADESSEGSDEAGNDSQSGSTTAQTEESTSQTEANDTAALADGEYSVTLNFDCYESKKDPVYTDYLIKEYAKLVVSTDETTNEKKYTLKLPIDYKSKVNFEWLIAPFGYSYSKYVLSEGVKNTQIAKQSDYNNLKDGLTSDDLFQIDDTTSAFCYVCDIPLRSLDDEIYVYFSIDSTYERLALTLSNIGEEPKIDHISPVINTISWTPVDSNNGVFYQNREITANISYDCSGSPFDYVCEYSVDDGYGYGDTLTTDLRTGRTFYVTMLGDVKYNPEIDKLNENIHYVITNRDAHALKIKSRVGAKYRGTDEVFWSEYREDSVNIAKAGVNVAYSDDTTDDFTNNIKPRIYATSNYVIPYDASLSISKVSDNASLSDVESLLKNETGRNDVDFSALNINLLDGNGNALEEIISPDYTSWSQFTARTFTLPAIKDFDLNNMSVYRYENGELIEQGTGEYLLVKVLDADTNEYGICFQPDTNGPSGTYVFIQKDYSDITETYKNNWWNFEAHLFDITDNLKTVAYDALIQNNKVYSYYSDDDAYIYVNLADISGEYAESIKYKPTGLDSFTEAEVMETVEKNGKTYPSVIRIPMTSTSAYIPLSFTFNGETKEVNLGISIKSANGAMVSKPTFTAPSINVKNADGNNVVNFTNDGVAYVNIDAPENGQKLLYTLTVGNDVIAENKEYTEPLELKSQSDEGTIYTLKTWVEAADTDAASSLANSAVVSEEISFSAKGAYAETAKTPVIGVQYKSGESLEDAIFKVTITSETDGATIYYTVDGSDPTTESAVYNEPFTVNGLTNENATVIKALAVKENANDSETVQKTVEFKTGWWDNLLPNSEYSIPVKMIKFRDTNALSMGNNAVAGDAVFKVDAKGNKTLTIPFKPINIGGTMGYVINFWYFPDESKAYTTEWKTYMLDYECEYTYNPDGTIKTVTLPVPSDEELIPAALEANVDIMGKQELYVKPDYSSVIEDVTGEKQESNVLDEPEIDTVLAEDKRSVTVKISMPASSADADAEIYYMISQDDNHAWDDSTATKYDPDKSIVVTTNDVNEEGITYVYAVAKSGDRQSIVASKMILFDMTIPAETLSDGVYNVPISALKAYEEDSSMMNNAIDGDAKVTVKDGKYTIEVPFKGIEFLGVKGHLLRLWIYNGSELTEDQRTEAKATSTFEDTDINGETSTFNKTFEFERESEDKQIFIRVNVDAMEGFDQNARLILDWSKAVKKEVEKSALQSVVNAANEKLADADLYTAESVTALRTAVTKAAEILKNTDATQEEVDQTTADLNTAIASLTKKPAAKNEWIKSGNRWWYRHADGSYTKNGWEKINNVWYYFDGAGWMKTGWVKDGNAWYYLKSSGAMATGWQKVNNVWYYFKSSGAMQTGWQKVSNVWYYFNASGAMQTGWQKISGKWYYFNTSGAMQTGWLKLSGKWYYCNSSGAMVTGTQTISGKTYKFDANGVWLS